MKKMIALFLIVLTVLSSVTPMSVLANESTQSSDSLTEGRKKIEGASLNTRFTSTSHGFFEIYFNGGFTTMIDILGAKDLNVVLSQTKYYVDGHEVHPTIPYNGATNYIAWYNNNPYMPLVGAGFTAGQAATFTVLIGENYYYEIEYTPNTTTLAYTDSETLYHDATNTLYTKITFTDTPSLKAGDELTVTLHETHPTFSAVVTAVNGNTVEIKAEGFNPTDAKSGRDKTICEFALDDGSKFAVSIDGKGETLPITSGREKVNTALHGVTNTTHGFFQVYYNGSAVPIKTLLGTTDLATIVSKTKFFINEKEVKPAYGYNGFDAYSQLWNGSEGGFSLLGAIFEAGVPVTFTALVGDACYYEVSYTPKTSNLGYTDAKTYYVGNTDTLYTAITFDDATAFSIGQEIPFTVHDGGDTTYTAVVTSINGNTVEMKAEGFSNTKSLCKFTLPDGTKFAVVIDEKLDTVRSYIQTRQSEDEGCFDARFLLEGLDRVFLECESVKTDITFTYDTDKTKSFSTTAKTVYKKVDAAGETLVAPEDFSYLGVIVTDIPNGIYDVTLTVTLQKGDTEIVNTFTLSDFSHNG